MKTNSTLHQIRNAVLFILFISIIVHSSGQNCFWSRQIMGISSDGSSKIAIDRDVNIYIAGEFSSPVLYSVSDTLYCNGVNDLFIAKYDQNGNEIWIKRFGGNNAWPSEQWESIGGLRYDSIDQSLLVCGSFYHSLDLGDTIIYGQGLDAFVMKMELDGNVKWVSSGGGV